MRKQETQLLIRWIVFMVALVVLAVSSWSVISESEAVYHTTPAFRDMETRELKLVNDAGEEIEILVRVADDESKREAGFAEIGAGVIRQSVVMLVLDRNTQIELDMRQVPVELDLAFINSEGIILEVIQTEPHNDSVYTFGVPFRIVLEAPAGFFSERQISKNGSAVTSESLDEILPEDPAVAN
jgi:hypothetical protein